LNDAQLKIVMDMARHVPHEKRGLFLERVAAMLKLRARRYSTDDGVGNAVKLALVGLMHESESAA
jgi:hypothetical protein